MKRILIISILLILFLSFTTAYASDATDNKTFEDIQKRVESEDIIELDGTFIGSGEAIIVSKPVAIKGSDFGAQLDAKSNSQILNIKSDDVTIENLVFANGHCEYGGAIYVDADNVRIINCSFTSNSAEYGGAIASAGNNLSIINCRFISNAAETSGGAFELDGPNNHVTGCVFKDNTAGHVGGAVSWVGANGTLTNSSFTSPNVIISESASYGGAVIWMGANGVLVDSTFTFNKAKSSGAAVYWKGNNGTLNYCDFSNNTSPYDKAYCGNPDNANCNYWGININSQEHFKSQKLIYFNKAFQSAQNWINPSAVTCFNLATYNVVNAKNGKYFKITITDLSGKPLSSKEVLISFNGDTYKRTTDKNGIASIQINVKNPGSYKVSAVFNGDNLYKPSSKTAKITVTKQKPTLTVTTKSLKLKAKKKTVKVYLKDQFKKAMSKKTVKLTINKKTYTAKTNSKGLASFKVTLKAKKNYSCTAKFAGDNYYSSAKKSSKIRVK
ncbi:hypothetical protein [Methanobrevibacter sp.]|uniref:hypothetical protein n=1 Tax=Methanobrevibacter sp. TaxID=66852 RepID=UPI0038679B37